MIPKFYVTNFSLNEPLKSDDDQDATKLKKYNKNL